MGQEPGQRAVRDRAAVNGVTVSAGPEFRALSTGVGLGPVAPRAAARQRSPVDHESPFAVNLPPVAAESRRTAPGDGGARHSSSPRAGHPPRRRRRLLRLLAHGIDVGVVLGTLAMTLTLLTLIQAVRSGAQGGWGELKSTPAAQWATEQGPLTLIASTYGLCLAYGLIFRLFTGQTPGESWLGGREEKATQSGGRLDMSKHR